jgi:adenylylsulfate kinase-like enzyme
MAAHHAEGVLVTGVYGAGKSSVAAEVATLLEARGVRYALLDLDYLGWASPRDRSRSAELQLTLQNLAAVTANYLQAGIERFVLAFFVRWRATDELSRLALALAPRQPSASQQMHGG